LWQIVQAANLFHADVREQLETHVCERGARWHAWIALWRRSCFHCQTAGSGQTMRTAATRRERRDRTWLPLYVFRLLPLLFHFAINVLGRLLHASHSPARATSTARQRIPGRFWIARSTTDEAVCAANSVARSSTKRGGSA
jgi:hypothetical protein